MRPRLSVAVAMLGLIASACIAEQPEPAIDAVDIFRQQILTAATNALDDDRAVVPGKDGWLFLTNELRHLGLGPFWGERAAEVSRASRDDWSDPLPVIVDFHEQLKGAGVELIFMPVPAKATVYPDKLDIEGAPQGNPTARIDRAHQAFYEELGEAGVTVIDLTPALIAGRDEAPMYCRTDTHWSPAACRLAAEIVRDRLNGKPWAVAEGQPRFTVDQQQININGDLRRMMDDTDIGPEELAIQRIEGEPLVDRGSPVLVLGDSHTLVFSISGDMHASDAGFAEQLAYVLNQPVDRIGVRGSGATPSRINLLRRGKGNLDGKKVVIWCLSVREFTEGQGWRPLPVVRK